MPTLETSVVDIEAVLNDQPTYFRLITQRSGTTLPTTCLPHHTVQVDEIADGDAG